MKKINLFLCGLAIAGLGFTSCSDDDNDSNTPNVEIAGTYNLTEVNTAAATDFNKDGTSNINQMNESDCYNGSRIVLNSDNTFTYQMNNILVDATAGTSACAQNTVSGTWSIYAGSGTTVIIRATYKNANGDDVTITLNKDANELNLYDLFGKYPNRNAQGGAIYTNGDVEMIFTK